MEAKKAYEEEYNDIADEDFEYTLPKGVEDDPISSDIKYLVYKRTIQEIYRIMSQLEDHCTSPAFLEPINEFIARTASKIKEIPSGKEHPHEYYQYFLQYTKLIDSLLESFLKEHQYTEKKVYECCLRLKQADPESLNCLDFVLATSEYEHFYGLMLEYGAPVNQTK